MLTFRSAITRLDRGFQAGWNLPERSVTLIQVVVGFAERSVTLITADRGLLERSVTLIQRSGGSSWSARRGSI